MHNKRGIKMKIKTDQLKYVADLARISLSKKETELFSKQLNNILKYMDKLNQSDTEGIEPMSHVLDIINVFREDKKKASLDKKDVLKNAPSTEEGFFKVPKVI